MRRTQQFQSTREEEKVSSIALDVLIALGWAWLPYRGRGRPDVSIQEIVSDEIKVT
jgi:hypothetical protein